MITDTTEGYPGTYGNTVIFLAYLYITAV